MQRCGKCGDQILDIILRSQGRVERLRRSMDRWTRSCNWHLEGRDSSCGAASSRESKRLDFESRVSVIAPRNC